MRRPTGTNPSPRPAYTSQIAVWGAAGVTPPQRPAGRPTGASRNSRQKAEVRANRRFFCCPLWYIGRRWRYGSQEQAGKMTAGESLLGASSETLNEETAGLLVMSLGWQTATAFQARPRSARARRLRRRARPGRRNEGERSRAIQ